jgi:hypothetical protein
MCVASRLLALQSLSCLTLMNHVGDYNYTCRFSHVFRLQICTQLSLRNIRAKCPTHITLFRIYYKNGIDEILIIETSSTIETHDPFRGPLATLVNNCG